MQLSMEPLRILTAWAKNAGANYIRTVSQTSQIGVVNGRASYPDGFVPLNDVPLASGGVPPAQADMNGILNAVSVWQQWRDAGGPVPYDATFSTAIGGYPQGSVLPSTTLGKFWLNLTDNNTTNPDSGGAGWVPFITVTLTQLSLTASGTNTITGTLSAGLLGYNAIIGVPVQMKMGGTNTGASTLNLNGLGGIQIRQGSSTLTGGELVNGRSYTMIYDGSYFNVMGSSGGPVNVGYATTANHAVALGQFAQTFSGNGTLKLPGGIIVQWGYFSIPGAVGTNQNFSFGTPFPNACIAIVGSYNAAYPSSTGALGVQPNNASTFTASNSAPSGVTSGCTYIAIGY